ncbi:VCBS repeat protein [Thiogranum longum]|uniref:VCBS repeat protein n=1 Tax=Thiogranum longum TaxID=1537524 RepID=A0A4R1HNP6_9GAMM|nr:FG-GAP-like repeat-containing protein [Thiogranum longum]TCK18892.1 VCBS repeat protein [Thiogranum longum]
MNARIGNISLMGWLLAILLATLAFPGIGNAGFSNVTTPAGLGGISSSRSASWGDYDNNGCVDLFVTGEVASALYWNDCNGAFQNVTTSAGAGGIDEAWSAAWADYDADGDLDLYIGRQGRANTLLSNDGSGIFTDVAVSAGVNDTRATAGVSWADYDEDGDLDLFVANRFGSGDLTDRLYNNNGDGTFTDVAVAAGVAGNALRKTFMGIWFDYDNNGLLDLYLAVDFGNDILYRNNGNGTFSDVSAVAGITDPQHGMGANVGDINNDGCLDILSSNNTQGIESDVEHNSTALYINNCDGTFSRQSDAMGILDRAVVEWGLNFIDFDNDMDLDVSIVAGGMLSAGEPNVLYENSGSCSGSLFDVTTKSGVGDTGQAFGSGWADYDNDGDLDWFVANANGENVLYRNDGPSGNYLKLDLIGAGANTGAIGTTVKVTAGGVTQTRIVQAGNSYVSMDENAPFFGLGVKDAADQVVIVWPTGTQTTLNNIAANQVLQVTESGAPPPPPPPPPPPADLALVTGTTFNSSGVPEEGVRVRALDPDTRAEFARVFSDVNGLYSIDLNPGTYDIRANKTGWGASSIFVTVGAGETHTVDFGSGTPPPPPPPPPPADLALVTGTTFNNAAGVPEEGVRVRALDPVTRAESARVFSDANGLYSLDLPAGTYDIRANKSGWGAISVFVTVVAGETRTVDISQ